MGKFYSLNIIPGSKLMSTDTRKFELNWRRHIKL